MNRKWKQTKQEDDEMWKHQTYMYFHFTRKYTKHKHVKHLSQRTYAQNHNLSKINTYIKPNYKQFTQSWQSSSVWELCFAAWPCVGQAQTNDQLLTTDLSLDKRYGTFY